MYNITDLNLQIASKHPVLLSSAGHLDVLPEERLVPPGLGVGELLELVHSRLGGPEPWNSRYIFTPVDKEALCSFVYL